MDIVLYERDFCPVYRINANPESTYYPCEGVIAVGEVKSRVGKQEFDDAVVKMESVKALERQFERLPNSGGGYGAPHRGYGGTDQPVFASFDPESDSRGDVVGFLLTDALAVEWETAMEYYRERTPQFPDLLIPLTGSAFASARDRKGRLALGAALLRWRPNQSLRRRRGRRQLDPSRRGEERRRVRWPTVLLSSATDGGLPLVLARFVRGLSTHQGSGCPRRLRTAATAAKCHRAPVDSHRVADQMPTGPSMSRRRAPHAASPLPRG